MKSPRAAFALALACLLAAGCDSLDSMKGSFSSSPRLPDPKEPSWQRDGAGDQVAVAKRTESDRDYRHDEAYRHGVAARNPDYGYIKSGAQAGSTGFRAADYSEPVAMGDWAEAPPSGSWGTSSEAPGALLVEVEPASTMSAPEAIDVEVARAPEPTPAPAATYTPMVPATSTFSPQSHSTPGSGSGTPMPAPTARVVTPAPAPAPAMAPRAAAPAPRAAAPTPSAPVGAPGRTYTPPPPPR